MPFSPWRRKPVGSSSRSQVSATVVERPGNSPIDAPDVTAGQAPSDAGRIDTVEHDYQSLADLLEVDPDMPGPEHGNGLLKAIKNRSQQTR
ncbi:unnamed protein product, partial [Discosporangium mesarthrocarpum]